MEFLGVDGEQKVVLILKNEAKIKLAELVIRKQGLIRAAYHELAKLHGGDAGEFGEIYLAVIQASKVEHRDD